MAGTRCGSDQAPRQRWMGLLARARPETLQDYWSGRDIRPAYDLLRGPEPGLVMIRGRTGGTGALFNLGETTVTRCSVRLDDGTIGHAYVSGRDRKKSEIAALVDALMLGAGAARIEQELLTPLEQAEKTRKRKRSRKAAATRVDFFTVVRGEDE